MDISISGVVLGKATALNIRLDNLLSSSSLLVADTLQQSLLAALAILACASLTACATQSTTAVTAILAAPTIASTSLQFQCLTT